jgi:hypothetical protein
MIASDAEKMAPVLNQLAKNEGTQDSEIPYIWPQADSILSFLWSIFDFYLKAFIQFGSELNSLSSGI